MPNPFANSIKFLTAINLLASPKGATIKSLMGELNVSRRTAFRLLEALEGLGFPLTDDQKGSHGEKIYRLMDCYIHKLPNISILNPGFTHKEMELIISIIDSVRNSTKSGDESNLVLLRQKCASLLPFIS
jgi:predicted DNA-binding transcriptional regulator YafY